MGVDMEVGIDMDVDIQRDGLRLHGRIARAKEEKGAAEAREGLRIWIFSGN